MAHESGTGKRSPSFILEELKGINFPASKQDLLNQAQSNDAPAEVREVLQKLPDKQYMAPNDVLHELHERVYR